MKHAKQDKALNVEFRNVLSRRERQIVWDTGCDALESPVSDVSVHFGKTRKYNRRFRQALRRLESLKLLEYSENTFCNNFCVELTYGGWFAFWMIDEEEESQVIGF